MARVKEVEFWGFKEALRRAIDTGRKLEPSDKSAWRSYLRSNRMSEPMMEEFAKSRFMTVQKVIILDDSDWAGFYMFSDDDEGAIRWES
jgi:hypothetical protein